MSQNIEEFPIIEELEASRRRSDDADDDDNDDAFTLLSFKKDIKRMHSVHRLIISACFNFLTIWCSLQFGACMQCPHDIL